MSEIAQEKEKIQLAYINTKINTKDNTILKSDIQEQLDLLLGKNEATVSNCGNGLFYNVTDGEINNLKISGQMEKISSAHVGGIVGNGNNINISDCESKMIITESLQIDNVGGIIGTLSGTSNVSNCNNYNDIKGRSNVGGIIGNINTTSIVNISNCKNKGNITSDLRYSGGIVGAIGNTDSNVTIQNCINEGNISVKSDYVGGIIGYIYGNSNSNVLIQKCLNKGSILPGDRYGGGIVGWNNNEEVKILLKNCYNNANVNASIPFSGQIIGSLNGILKNVQFIENFYTIRGDLKGISMLEDINGDITALDKEYNSIEEILSLNNI